MLPSIFSQVSRMMAVAVIVIVASLQYPTDAAAEPKVTVRTLGYFAGTNPLAVPDFLSDDSVLVTRTTGNLDALGGSAIRFMDSEVVPCHPGQPEILEGSYWLSAPARHVTKGGENEIREYFWLIDEQTPGVPSNHAFTRTGNAGLVLSQAVYLVNKCVNGSCCNDSDLDGLWYVAGEGSPSNSGDYFVVVTALFFE